MITCTVLLYHSSFMLWLSVYLLRTAASIPLELYRAETFCIRADHCDQGQSVNTGCQRILNEGVCKWSKWIPLLPLKFLHWLHIPLVSCFNKKVTGIFLVTYNYCSTPSVASDPKSVHYKILSFQHSPLTIITSFNISYCIAKMAFSCKITFITTECIEIII